MNNLFFSKFLTILIVSMFCLLFISCSHSNRKKFCAEDTIYVSYFIPDVEFSVRMTCEKMSLRSRHLKVEETVHIDKDDFDEIRNLLFFNSHTIIDKDCDARLIIESDSLKMCIGNFTCQSFSPPQAAFSLDSIIYFIKCKSDYYNCKTKDELLSDKLILKFGIPSDYGYRESEKENDRQIKLMRKIAFVRK